VTEATTEPCADVCAAIPITELPAIGALLRGGTYAGAISQPDGALVAVVLLPGVGENLTWAKAKAWAKKQGGELPSRPVAALLYASVKAQLRPRRHWTSEAHDASYAWLCNFIDGYQYIGDVGFEACAVAVRLIPIKG